MNSIISEYQPTPITKTRVIHTYEDNIGIEIQQEIEILESEGAFEFNLTVASMSHNTVVIIIMYKTYTKETK